MRIKGINELSLETLANVAGGTGYGNCSCSSQCTCECDNSREAPKASTARENHRWESKAVMARTQRNNF